MKQLKPYFRDKGKYVDGRRRIIIEQPPFPSLAIPKPEVLRELLKIINQDYPYLIGHAKKQARITKFSKGMTHD